MAAVVFPIPGNPDINAALLFSFYLDLSFLSSKFHSLSHYFSLFI